MKYIDIGCPVNCWECTRSCEYKKLMIITNAVCESPQLSVSSSYMINNGNGLRFFNYCIIEAIKLSARQLIEQGKNPIEVQQDVIELAVSFYVARLKMLEIYRD